MVEGPYKLPKGWRWVRLGEVAIHIQSGFAFRKKDAQKGEVIHLRPYNIGEDGELRLKERFFVPRASLPRSWSPLRPGDVLFNNTNSVDLVGKTALVREEMEAAFSNHITLIRVDSNLCVGSWLALSLNELWRKGYFAQRCNKWVGQAGYNTQMLQETLIPLPPLAEQRRIVARVEALMERIREARRLREQARQDAERLWQSVLAETFPRPGSDLPKGWRWVRLGEVASRDAKTIKPSDMPDRAFNYLGLEHVAPNQWEEPELTLYLGAEIRSSVIKFWPGLVLYGKLRPYLNKVVVPSTEGVASTEFVPIKPDKKTLLPSFLGAFLRSPNFVSYATSNTIGSRQPRVRMRALWNALIPLPPLAEQRRIVAYLHQLQARMAALQKAQESTEAELHRLEQAILDKAFRGEL